MFTSFCSASSKEEAEITVTISKADHFAARSWEDVANLDIPFHGVNYDRWDPEVHHTYVTPEGEEILSALAKKLVASADVVVKIKGFCGPPQNPKMMTLAAMRAKVVEDTLKACGCRNEFLPSHVGFEMDSVKGPRCEVELCQVSG